MPVHIHIHKGRQTVTKTVGRVRDREPYRASGIVYINEEGEVLLCLRTDGEGWAFPAGKVEQGEMPADGAVREFKEEMGHALDRAKLTRAMPSGSFVAFAYQGETFTPRLDHEHSDWGWFDLEDLPEPLHPNTQPVLRQLPLTLLTHDLVHAVATADAEFDENEHPRDSDGKFAANGGSASKPTKASAKGSKAGVHELLSSGHAFSIEELMEATGTTNKATITTALSDLKNPKYAGALGHLRITKRSDGLYHVEKGAASASAAVKQADPMKAAIAATSATEPTVVRVERTPDEGTKHWVRVPGDDREWPLVRSDSTQGLGMVWSAAIGGGWENYADGPTPSQNGYIGIQSYLGDTKEEALRKLPDAIKQLDASPYYSKVKETDEKGITKEWFYDRRKGDFVVTFTDPDGHSELGEVYRARSLKEAKEMSATSLALKTRAEQDAADEERYGKRAPAKQGLKVLPAEDKDRFQAEKHMGLMDDDLEDADPHAHIANVLMDDEFKSHVVRGADGKVQAAGSWGPMKAGGEKWVELHHLGSTVKGGGSALVEEAKRQALELGVPIKLSSVGGSEGFYEKHGFKKFTDPTEPKNPHRMIYAPEASALPTRARTKEPTKPATPVKPAGPEWVKHDHWHRATLPGDYKAAKTERPNGDIAYTVRGGDSVYVHHILTDADGKVLRHHLEKPITIRTVKGPDKATTQSGLNPNQAAKFKAVYTGLGLTPWHQQKP